jgi:hypothetical protein
MINPLKWHEPREHCHCKQCNDARKAAEAKDRIARECASERRECSL